MKIDLNADVGEGFPNDLALLDRVSSANVSCGAHAGNAKTILNTAHAALDRNVAVGAHPGHDDREHFGRKELSLSETDIIALVDRQIREFLKLTNSCGVEVGYVKPHGALYNQAQKEDRVARAIVAAIAPFGLAIVGQPESRMQDIAEKNGLRFVREGFIDRRYRGDGRLVARSEPNAILTDPSEIEEQIVRLIQSGFETLCLHGDDPRAVELADLALGVLRRRGVSVRSFLEPTGDPP